MLSKYFHAIRLPWIPSEKIGCLWFALKRNRSFPLSTLPTLPCQVEQKDPSHTDCQEERNLPTLPERETPSSRRQGWRGGGAGGGLQRYQSTLGVLCRELPPAPPRKVPTLLPERALYSTPALTAHSTRGETKRGYHSRSRSTVWGLCYTDLSIMILGSPIQGIRCRPCSWY